MGLDMFAFQCHKDDISDGSVDFDEPVAKEEIAYWRKHSNLHGWMENLYLEKGGKAEFNCVPVRLVAKDLNLLKEYIEDGELPETSGFFFGSSDGSKEERKYDLDFIDRALAAIADGHAVYYSSWW